jgi:hypothetical protein
MQYHSYVPKGEPILERGLMILEGFSQLPIRFIPQKVSLNLNSAINYINPMDIIHWGFLFPLQILLDPVFGRNPMLLLKGCEEDGFAFEPGAVRDALDGGAQMCAFTQ